MTKIVKTLPITEQELTDFKRNRIEEWINADCEKIEQQLSDLVEFVDKLVKSQEYIYISNKDVYYIPSIVGLFPNVGSFNTSLYCYSSNTLSKSDVKNKYSLKVCDGSSKKYAIISLLFLILSFIEEII